MNSQPPDLVPVIRSLVSELGFMPSNAQVGATQSLFDAGILDSLRLMQLVPCIEQRLGISVAADDLIPENFDSLERMSRFVGNRRSA